MLVWLYTALTAVQPAPLATAVSAEVGKEVLARFECNRCHEGTGLAPAPLKMHCVQCHRDIHAGTFTAKPALLKRWKRNIVNLTVVPSLVGLHQRFRRDWLREFLQEPHDLRPKMTATMPRLAISNADADLLARYLVPRPAAPARVVGDAARGRVLLDTRGCGLCHTMSGVSPLKASQPKTALGESELRDALQLAPDLAFTRGRFQTARLVQWLRDPRSLKRDALMPKEDLTEAQARDIAAYLLEAVLTKVPPIPMPKPLPALKKRVTYETLASVVFGHTCVHCHADPDYAVGDGGPGNTGGFGYKPRGIILTDYSLIQAGYIGADGERHSLFEKMPDGRSRLVASLWARHSEVRGKPIKGLRGMPLGLEPLNPEHIRLVETWVSLGRPE